MARAAAGEHRAVTITLRGAKRADDAWLDAWLPDVAASVGYPWHARAESPRRVWWIIEASGERVGVVVLNDLAATRAAIELIATMPQHARRGVGMQAAVLIEDELRARGVREIIAPAPAAHGIAMYFWIRLGYAPLPRAEWPCAREGVAWVSREIRDQRSQVRDEDSGRER